MQSGHSEKHLGCTEPDESWGPADGTQLASDTGHDGALHPEPVLVWAPSGRSLLSGLLGLNVMLFGAALVAANAFHPQGLRHQEPMVYLLLLMGLSVAWMLWYLLWARSLGSNASPHKDHHAGGITVTVVLMIFAGFSLLLLVFNMGYYIMMSDCKPLTKILFPFIEAPFLGLQTYLIWAHSKDCIHKHKILNRCGLIVLLSADLLLWLNAVSDDTVHQEIEMERQHEEVLGNITLSSGASSPDAGLSNSTQCQCGLHPPCRIFRKGIEVLYPFNIEFYLMAGCMIYVMWKNVGRRTDPAAPHHETHKLTLRVVFSGGIVFGPLLGILVLVVGMTIFILYQVWVSQRPLRLTAFLLFYGYHLALLPIMSLFSLAGVLEHKLQRRAHDDEHNPTRSLDVMLLVLTALGQLSLSYFSVVAALANGIGDDVVGGLDLSFSLLSLLELVLQNIFIIEGLHKHPSLTKGRAKVKNIIFKRKKTKEERASPTAPGVETAPTSGQESNNNHHKTRRVIKEICAFLVLSNIMLWVIPAFGAHPQFENGLGKEFYGFTAWFVLVNLGQPLGVFYRMHSVGALMELLISA